MISASAARPPNVPQFSRMPVETRTALWRAVIAPPSSRTTRRLNAHFPKERPRVAISTTSGRKNIVIERNPMMITRWIDADGEVNLAAIKNSTNVHRVYVVASMTAAAKRSGGEAGVTSRVTASPVRTKSS